MMLNNLLPIIICHGNLADGLKSAFDNVMGQKDVFAAFTNYNKNIEFLKNEILTYINASSEKIPVYFIDLKGGSCWKTAKILQKETKKGMIINGVSLPVLINFISKVNEIKTIDDIEKIILAKSRQSMSGE
jgi:mannose/fructose-specific phosphotransferase system component IIA